jgi:hypothetical protein
MTQNNASSVPSDNDPLNLEETDRQIRISRLRDEINKVTGEEVLFGQSDHCPPEILEKFLEQVLEIERAKETTHLELLAREGIYLRPPDELNDTALHDELWQLIRGLEKLRTFLYRTNHLSDRELYTHLWTDSLRESTFDLKGNPDAGCGIDILGGGSDEDIDLDMKYYADEEERARWLKGFPDYQMPPHEDPPYDRDRFLPRRGWPWDQPHPDGDQCEDEGPSKN